MNRFFLVSAVLLFCTTSSFAEYKLETVHCTENRKSNCGAYLYNTTTGATYFCDSKECNEIMPALEEGVEEASEGTEKSKKSKIPKKPKKEKKSKIPKMKKTTE